MSRHAASEKFTRFTSTSPYAASKPPATSTVSYQPPSPRSQVSTNSSFINGSGSEETPKEKVARLRAAARAAKAKQSMSVLDRMIDRGRVWADIGHRVVTYGLIGFTGIATVISLYGLGSLITHNRRQKRAWVEREMQRLTDAQTAFLRGEATPEQLHLLEQERAGEEMAKKVAEEKRRKKEAGMWRRLKEIVGVSSGDMGLEKESPGQVNQEGNRRLQEGWINDSSSTVNTAASGRITQAVQDSRREGEQDVVPRTGVTGGPLDVLASNVAGAITQKTHSDWLSWVRSGKS